jgi:amino acid adenylation domain-containing protein
VAFLLHQLIAESAQREPGREAVRCRGTSLSYGQLESAANGVARALIDSGVRRGDRVAIHLPKSVEMVAAVYGVLKAGAAYVPLDLKAPVARLSVVASDCTIRALITTTGRAHGLLAALDGQRPPVVILVEDGSPAGDGAAATVTYEEATRDPEASDPGVSAIESDLAYILYTSGSTGVPKGVMLTHRNALTFVEWCATRIGVGPDDRLSNHAPLNFDLSVLDLFLAARGGATVIPIPEEQAYFGNALARTIREDGITVWYSVPSALMVLMRHVKEPGELPSLRTVIFAGEVFPTKHLRELRRLVPGAFLWNLYGPTETNVCTYYPVEELPADDRTIPIGRACENTEVFALRPDGEIAGVGEEGELYVRGPTVMRGYWGRPEKTAEMLVPNPVNPHLGELVYRTGDLVRLRPDGDYDFLGRRDHQIKSRGYRIELGEIEAALNAHPGLAEAVAVAVPHEEWGTAIVAHVVPRVGERLTAVAVKRHVADRLPRYMVPAAVEVVEALPRTSTGKIDRQSVQRDAAGTPSVASA